ncbi:MAG TPA: glycine zipper 2TM domain-containing protein [Rhodanobacteraceae bacterium]|nr:glycine zipper 2TM domain-containing protein [Rhodanobacteraceae bacterium]
MKLRDFLIAIVLGTVFTGAGTSTAIARDHYDHDRCHNCGTVVGIEQVSRKDDHVGAGTAIGAIAGGVLGSTVGKGNGRTAATVGGAVAGGAIGHQVEKNNRDRDYAWRFIVDMDSGRRVTVVQRDNSDIREGDRVRVYNGRLERF